MSSSRSPRGDAPAGDTRLPAAVDVDGDRSEEPEADTKGHGALTTSTTGIRLDRSPSWQRVAENTTSRTIPKGETIFLEGDYGDALYLIADGYVAIRKSTSQGDETTLTILGPGDAFGEQALLLPDNKRTASAVAVRESTLRMLPRSTFDQLRRDSPEFHEFLVELLTAQVQRLSDQLVDSLFAPAEKRIWRRLAALLPVYEIDSERRRASDSGEDEKDDGSITSELPITQAELAGMVGVTRQTVNAVLGEAQRDGIIEVRWGRIIVLDPQRALGKV